MARKPEGDGEPSGSPNSERIYLVLYGGYLWARYRCPIAFGAFVLGWAILNLKGLIEGAEEVGFYDGDWSGLRHDHVHTAVFFFSRED